MAGGMMLSWWWQVVAVVVWAAVTTTTGQDKATGDSHVVNQLEQSLLSSFGLRQRPRSAKNVVVPPYMLQLFNRQQQQDGAQEHEEKDEGKDAPAIFSPNTFRSFTHKESEADRIYPAHKLRLRFNVTTVPVTEDLKSAELRLTHIQHPVAPEKKKAPPPSPNTPQPGRRRKKMGESAPFLQRVLVYDVLRRATRVSDPALRLLDTRVIDAREPGIQSLDLTDAVRRWVHKPATNHGVLVEIVPFTKTTHLDTSHVRLRRSVEEQDTGLDRQPLLVVHTHDGQAVRKRRSVEKHRKTDLSCRRHSLHVDFRKVGWDDWIVAPAGYDAYYCKGECPFPLPDMLNATNHAVVQTLVNSRYPERVPKACCVPTELSPISMLYMDDDERFVLKNHQNMVVEGCGCR